MTEKNLRFSQTGGMAVGECWQETKAGRVHLGFPGGSAAKESTCNEGDLDSIPGLGRSPREGKGYQYFGHLMQRTDSLEKTLMLEKSEGRRRRGQQDAMVG